MLRTIHNENWKKAVEHFKSTGEWFPGCVLHHADVTLKYRDYERYCEWRIEDLVVMSNSEHARFHASGKVLSEETKAKLSLALSGRELGDETRQKLSDSHLGINTWTAGSIWFTNGVQNVRRMKCPEGFWPGKTQKKWSKKKEAVNA